MKTGIYLRYVPVAQGYRFYSFDGVKLMLLGSAIGEDADWYDSHFDKPSRRNGFSLAWEF